MASRHLDVLVRDFISGSGNPYAAYDPFNDLQDPTFLSFYIDFFPDGGRSIPTDFYSSGGLLRPPGSNDDLLSYSFGDSAADYLARIGAPTRQAELQKFINMLSDIQSKAPWYFQSISGLADLYKIDKAINYRGKDKVLTIDCLESIDMRMTMLADLYRNVAFDFQNWREVLPINLRTFNMRVHVLEMRSFNTTYGIIADSLSNRPVKGEDEQKKMIEAASKKNVYGGNTSLFSGTLDNIGNVASAVNNALGGLFTNLGDQAGQDALNDYKSAFEAISVQTFNLRDCEFDFFTEGPGYLDTVDNKAGTEGTFKFKIHVGKIEKQGVYPFYQHVISEWTKNSYVPDPGIDLNYSTPYFEPRERKDAPGKPETYKSYREAIYPQTRTQNEAYLDAKKNSDSLRKRPLEAALGRLVQNAVPQVNQSINQALGNLTGGVLGTAPLGNVYGDPSFIARAREALNNFLTPGNQITTGQKSATVNPENLPKNSLTGASPNTSPASGNVYSNNPQQTQQGLSKINIYEGTPPLPTPDLGNDTNVFE